MSRINVKGSAGNLQQGLQTYIHRQFLIALKEWLLFVMTQWNMKWSFEQTLYKIWICTWIKSAYSYMRLMCGTSIKRHWVFEGLLRIFRDFFLRFIFLFFAQPKKRGCCIRFAGPWGKRHCNLPMIIISPLA